MTARTDAIRKVKALLALANGSGFPQEALEAEKKAISLRLVHGISDAELAEPDQEDLTIFGVNLFWYSNNVTPHVERMREEIAAAIEKIDAMVDEFGTEKARSFTRLYSDVKDMLDYRFLGSRRSIKQWRNEEVKRLYDKLMLERYGPDALGSEDDEIALHRHNMIVSEVASRTDLRRDVVETAVGRHRKYIEARVIARLNKEDEDG